MDDFFICIKPYFNYFLQGIKEFTLLNNNFFISCCIFCVCVLSGFVTLIICCAVRSNRQNVKPILILYIVSFFTDLALCFCECEFSHKIFYNFAHVFTFCYFKFLILFVIYLMVAVCASAGKPINGAKFKDAECINGFKPEKNELKPENAKKIELNNVTVNENICDKNGKDYDYIPQKSKIIERFLGGKAEIRSFVDINVAYIKKIIESLKVKDLSDEDKETLGELEFRLGGRILYDGETVSKLNELLRFLVKKAAEYEVAL